MQSEKNKQMQTDITKLMNKTSTFLTISNETISPWTLALTSLGHPSNFSSGKRNVDLASNTSRLGLTERSCIRSTRLKEITKSKCKILSTGKSTKEISSTPMLVNFRTTRVLQLNTRDCMQQLISRSRC